MDRPGTQSWRRDQARALLDFCRGSALPGGGFGWLGDDGTIAVDRPRPLFITARMTYAFTLAHLDTDDADAGRLATAGLASLLRDYADRQHGGWFASLDRDGSVDDPRKANYAHAHVVLASATGVAAGLDGAQDVLAHAVAAIEQHFWSDEEGCAVEEWDATFTELDDYRGANSNMHSLEAYLVAGDVTGDPVWHRRGLSIASTIVDHWARADGWRIPEHYDTRWRPIPDYNKDKPADQFRPYGTTPGHSFEWARLLLELEGSLTDPPPWLLEAAVGLFDAAALAGWAPDGHDGFVYTLDPDDRPVVSERLHWVVCEALLAAAALRRRTGDARFDEVAATWWQHVADHFLDTERGGWFQELSADLVPSSTIWSGKPDLYHSYQSLLLPSLPVAPCAALSLARRRDGVAIDSA